MSESNNDTTDTTTDSAAAEQDDVRQHTEVEAEGPEAGEGTDAPRAHTQDPAEG